MNLSSLNFWSNFFGWSGVVLTALATIAASLALYFTAQRDAAKDEADAQYRLQAEERLKPWRLTRAQREQISAALSSKTETGSITIIALAGNAQAQEFARDISNLLANAGWTIGGFGTTDVPEYTSIGLKLEVLNDTLMPQALALKAALDTVLAVPIRIVSQPGNFEPLQLIVGLKP